MDAKELFNGFDSWQRIVKAFKEWNITSYTVEPNCKEFRVENGVFYIPPEAELVVSEILKEVYRNGEHE